MNMIYKLTRFMHQIDYSTIDSLRLDKNTLLLNSTCSLLSFLGWSQVKKLNPKCTCFTLLPSFFHLYFSCHHSRKL